MLGAQKRPTLMERVGRLFAFRQGLFQRCIDGIDQFLPLIPLFIRQV
jgi:hypothetical protein